MHTKKVTIRDVAEAAGVSVGLVSFALNGTGRVSDETRQRIRDAAKRLGYRTPPAPLPKPGEHFLVALVPDLEDRVGTLRQISSDAYSNGYSLVTATYGISTTRFQELLDLFSKKDADGFVIDAPSGLEPPVGAAPWVYIGNNCIKELLDKFKNEQSQN